MCKFAAAAVAPVCSVASKLVCENRLIVGSSKLPSRALKRKSFALVFLKVVCHNVPAPF